MSDDRPTGAVPPRLDYPGVEPTRFHLRSGLYFDKRDDGYVRICYAKSGLANETPQAICEVPPNEWASVVAFLSAHGEHGDSFAAALRFHEGYAHE